MAIIPRNSNLLRLKVDGMLDKQTSMPQELTSSLLDPQEQEFQLNQASTCRTFKLL